MCTVFISLSLCDVSRRWITNFIKLYRFKLKYISNTFHVGSKCLLQFLFFIYGAKCHVYYCKCVMLECETIVEIHVLKKHWNIYNKQYMQLTVTHYKINIVHIIRQLLQIWEVLEFSNIPTTLGPNNLITDAELYTIWSIFIISGNLILSFWTVSSKELPAY